MDRRIPRPPLTPRRALHRDARRHLERRRTATQHLFLIGLLLAQRAQAPDPMERFDVGDITVLAERRYVALATALAEAAAPARAWPGLGRVDPGRLTLAW